jgi:N utilization substance protein B
MKNLFSQTFTGLDTSNNASEISAHLNSIDSRLARAAPEWPLEKISKVDLSILRLAVFELLIEKKEPPKVIIDEAIELAKAYGNEQSAKFVNGVLGTILKTL